MRISRRVWALRSVLAIPFACAAAVSTVRNVQAAQLTPAEIAWRQDALKRGEAIADSPDLRITSTQSSNTHIELIFDVVRTPPDQKPVLAIAVPTADYTTGSVLQFRRSSFGNAAADAGSQYPVVFEQLGYVRGYKVARVSFTLPSAVAQDPVVSGTLRLEFTPPTRQGTADPAWIERESTGPIRAALERMVANPQDLTRFLAKSAAEVPGAPPTAWTPVGSSSPFRLRVPIDRDGIYQVSGADLASSGVDILNLRPQSLRLLLEGESQPLHFMPANPQSANAVAPQDRWIFYGRMNSSIYATTNTYWLIADDTSTPTLMQQAQLPVASEPSERAQVFREVQKVEEENSPVLTKNDQFLTILGFHWAWWTWTDGRGAVPEPTPLDKPRQFSFDLPGLYVSGGNVSVSAHIYAHAWPTGQAPITMRIRINDSAPVDLRIDSPTDEKKDFEILASALRETGNTAVLELEDAVTTAAAAARRQYLELCFERLEINYQRLYRATPSGLAFDSPPPAGNDPATSNPAAVRNIDYNISGVAQDARTLVLDITDTAPRFLQHERTGDSVRMRVREQGLRKYQLAVLEQMPHASIQPFVPGSDLRNTDIAADYVIISHPLFMQAMQPFAQRKAAAGHKVQLVDINDIYDQFGAGHQTPHALRTFIRYITGSWKGSAHAPAATYVLFVGDSSSAYRDEFRNGVTNYVPSMTVGESGDRYASDHWFVSSFGSDLLADNLLGRFSVNNLPDLATILEKQTDYAERPGAGPWLNTLGFVADHSDFESTIENVMNQTVPSRFFLQRIFMSEEPWIDNYYFPLEVAEAKKSKVSPKTTAKIRDLFNAGAAMVTYFGHGSPNVWSNERIWFGGDSENSDNRMLTNRDKLSFIVNMTCNSGAIDYPMPRWNICISEDFMRIANGGAVACYVPSGPGITSQHEKFTLQLNRALLEERITPLGPALALANWRYLLFSNPPDLVRMFILLGEPDLQLQLATPLQETVSVAPPLAFVQSIASTSGKFDATPVTTVTGTLAPPASNGAGVPEIVAVMPSSPAFQIPRSSAIPYGDAPSLSVTNVRRRPDGLVARGQQVEFAIALKNTSRIPAKRVVLEVSVDGKLVGKSAPFELLPMQDQVIPVSVTVGDGIARLEFSAVTDSARIPVTATDTVLVTATAQGDLQHALIIDPKSVQTRYSPGPSGYTAAISLQAYNAGSDAINSAVATLETSNREIVTTVPISSVASNAAAYVSITLPMQTTAPAQLLSIHLTSGTLTFDQPQPVQVRVSPEDVPDLVIVPNGIRVSSSSPSDGETVMFEVTVTNAGRTTADSVRVEGYLGDSTSETQRLESRISAPVSSFALEPGTSKTVQVRWDPFHNAGPQHIQFRVNNTSAADRDPSNNSQSIDLRVRTKSRVRPINIKVADPTPEDYSKRQIQVVATLRNDGETDAQGIRIVFYPTPKRVAKDAMGDVIIDVLPAGQSRDAILTYKLKPGEEKFPFVPSCETMLKGSLQRTPLTQDK